MKLTESRIKQIIQEEVEQARQEQEETKTIQELKAFLLKLSKQATQIKGASPQEVKAAAELILSVLRSLSKGEVSRHIQHTSDVFDKKIGNKE